MVKSETGSSSICSGQGSFSSVSEGSLPTCKSSIAFLTLCYTGGGTINTHVQMILRDALADAPNELIFHDFVSFNISQDPLRPFFKKISENFENSKKVNFQLRDQRVPPLDQNRKNFKICFFFQKIILFHLESEFYMF